MRYPWGAEGSLCLVWVFRIFSCDAVAQGQNSTHEVVCVACFRLEFDHTEEIPHGRDDVLSAVRPLAEHRS